MNEGGKGDTTQKIRFMSERLAAVDSYSLLEEKPKHIFLVIFFFFFLNIWGGREYNAPTLSGYFRAGEPEKETR